MYAKQVPRCFEFDLLRVHPHWFTLYRQKAEKGWFVMYPILVPFMRTLVITSLILPSTTWQHSQQRLPNFQTSTFNNWKTATACCCCYIPFPSIGHMMHLHFMSSLQRENNSLGLCFRGLSPQEKWFNKHAVWFKRWTHKACSNGQNSHAQIP